MMIPEEIVTRITDAARIEDVVGDFVQLKRNGSSLKACCPFHNEKTPSFIVTPSKGIYKCFGCGKSGTSVGFLMEYNSMTYPEALRYLAQKYHIEIPEREMTAEELQKQQHRESLMLVTEYAWKFFKDALHGTQEGRSVGMQYFHSRGLEDETIDNFGLGWAPTGRNGSPSLVKAALAAGYKPEYLLGAGLAVKREDGSLRDRFYDRVVFPIFNSSGRVIAFGCRTLSADKSVAKYVNSPETEIYLKHKTLYGIDRAKFAIGKEDRCILVEGYLDVISMHQLGITNVVASSGTSLTEDQIELISRYTKNVTIIYDGDSAGIKAAFRGIGMVLKAGLKVKVVLLPDGDDPDSYSRKHNLEEVKAFIEQNAKDFINFKTDLLYAQTTNDPQKLSELIYDLADTIALIPEEITRLFYARGLATRFSISEDVIIRRVEDTRSMMLEQEYKRERQDQMGWPRKDERLVAGDASMVDVNPPGGSVVGSSTELTINNVLLAPLEKELLSYILLSGQEYLLFDSSSPYYTVEPALVANFIDAALSEEGEFFENNIYKKVYDEYFVLFDEGLNQEQIIGRLRTDHATLVDEMMIPKYDLTVGNYASSLTKPQTILITYVPRAIFRYKLKRLELEIDRMQKELAQVADNEELVIDLMMKIQNANTIRLSMQSRLDKEGA